MVWQPPILLAWLLRKFKNTDFYHRRQQLAEEKKAERVKIALPVTIVLSAVGHSMGAYAWVYYGMHWGADPNLPRLNKMVVLAGPYNGILDKGHANQPKNGALAGLWDDAPHENSLDKNGRPKIIHEEYNTLLARKNNFPINTQVLNIYGDLKDGTSSDGLVTVQSTRALRYLVSDRARSYQEFEVAGEGGQHSRLHINNPVVNDKLTDYLWGK